MCQSNLKPVQSKEEARQRGRNGGIKSGESRREKKLFKEAIEKKLCQNLDGMIDSMIEQAKKGNVKAITFLRDTIGEKPINKIEGNIGLNYEEALKKVSGKDEY